MKHWWMLTLALGLALANPLAPQENPAPPGEELDPGEGGGLENFIVGAFCAAKDSGQIDWDQIPWASLLPAEMREYYEMLFRKLCPLYPTTQATAYAKNRFLAQAANFYNEVNKRDTITAIANNFETLIFGSGKELKELANELAQDFGSLQKGQLDPQGFFDKYHQRLTALRNRAIQVYDSQQNPFIEDTGAFYRLLVAQKSESLKTQEKMNLREQSKLAEKVVNNQFLLAQSGRVQQRIANDNSHLEHLRAVTGLDPVNPTTPDAGAPVPKLNRMAEEAISERMALQVVVRALTEQMSQSASETAMLGEYLKTQAALQAMTNQQLSMLLQSEMERQQAALDAKRVKAERWARDLYQMGLSARQNVVSADALLANMTRKPYETP